MAPDPASTDGSTCIIIFSAGPPYEDIAFRYDTRTTCTTRRQPPCACLRCQYDQRRNVCLRRRRFSPKSARLRTRLMVLVPGPPRTPRIVNKEWEYSHKRGFKCTFDRGILHVYFNFKRTRYRR